MAAASDIVMLCMDTSDSVESRMYGDDGVIAGLKPGAIVIDFGTSLPGLNPHDWRSRLQLQEAPILTLHWAARLPMRSRASSTSCAQGTKAAFERVKPVLEDLGENVFHLGALGSGHTIKLINNFFGMTMANAMAEAFAMADIAGIERQKLYDVMSAGPLHSGMMDFVKAYGVDGDPSQLAFAIKNARKDVGYYATMADDAGVTSLMSTGTKQAFGIGIAEGRGEHMVSQMVDFFADLFGTKK